MTSVTDFPVEIMAKVFTEMQVEDAWAARAVCRYWHSVFELVSYSSTQSPLTGIKVGVEAVCGITTSKGQLLDKHVVHGDLKLETSKKTNGIGPKRQAQWVHEKKKYEYWPRGNWRKLDIVDVLTDVKLHISGLPSRSKKVSLRLGREVSIRQGNSQANIQVGSGKFQDFTLLIDTVEEPLYGNVVIKHCINGFVAPKWQIYALLVHHAKSERELSERLHRHYVQSYRNSFSHVLPKPKAAGEQIGPKICAGASVWIQFPPRWNIGAIEC